MIQTRTRSKSNMKTVFMLFLVLLTAIPTWAWDTTPNKKGKYDKFYERPTHFPDFKQPGTWPNAQYYMVMPSMNSVLSRYATRAVKR